MFFKEVVMKKLESNANKTLLKIVYDDSVIQTFTPNVRNSHFEKMEYILPIIDFLRIEINEEICKMLITQLGRDCMNWSGKMLIENLLILNKFDVIFLKEMLSFLLRNLIRWNHGKFSIKALKISPLC